MPGCEIYNHSACIPARGRSAAPAEDSDRMSRVILFVVLLGLGIYFATEADDDSTVTVAAVAREQPSPTAVPTLPPDAWPSSDATIAGLTALPAGVAAASEVIGADRWQIAGFTGYGVRVAIVDTGFDGYQSQLGSSLPDEVHARSFRADGRIESGSEHGTLAARIVHSIAPRAELYLVNFGTVQEFADLVAYLQEERVQVVSFSLGFVHNGPGDGTGEVDDIISKAVAGGQLWTVAAGNWARQHWAGVFTDRNGNFIHEFVSGAEDNGRSYYSGDLITASLRWDQPWGRACTDYDLELFGPDGALVQASRNIQACSGNPVESLQVLATKTGRYRARVVQSGASAETPRLDLLMLGSPDRGQPLDYAVAAGSLAEPADHPGVVTIGAENPFDSALVADFSSRGPTKDGRSKPDFIAPAGVATGGETGFAGTSAATPHAAGAAALLFEAFPGATATDIARELRERAAPPSLLSAVSARMVQLGAFDTVGPVLPPGDGLASLEGVIPDGAGIAALRYRGPDGFPARFAHLLLDRGAATVYYRLDATGRAYQAFVVGAPRSASTFEVFHDGDVLLARFP